MVSLILAIMPYCTPQPNPAPCIDWMLQCLQADSEENCSENIPLELEP